MVPGSELSWRSTQPYFNLGHHIGGFSYHGKLLFGTFLCGTSGFGSSHAKSKSWLIHGCPQEQMSDERGSGPKHSCQGFHIQSSPRAQIQALRKERVSVGQRWPSRRRVSLAWSLPTQGRARARKRIKEPWARGAPRRPRGPAKIQRHF